MWDYNASLYTMSLMFSFSTSGKLKRKSFAQHSISMQLSAGKAPSTALLIQVTNLPVHVQCAWPPWPCYHQARPSSWPPRCCRPSSPSYGGEFLAHTASAVLLGTQRWWRSSRWWTASQSSCVSGYSTDFWELEIPCRVRTRETGDMPMVLPHFSDSVVKRFLWKCRAAKELAWRDIISHVGAGLGW